jgi:hypothetical protein
MQDLSNFTAFEDGQHRAARNGVLTVLSGRRQCEAVLRDGLNTLSAKTEFNDVAILDAKFMYVIASVARMDDLEAGYREVILDALKRNKRPLITQMTYEDIILNNPADELRTFTSGTIAKSEMLFYRGHQLIEDELRTCIQSLKEADKIGEVTPLKTAYDAMAKACEIGHKVFIRALDSTHFMAFKPFFDTNPYTGEKGPSGAFTASIPHIDMLLYGRETPQSLQDYIRVNKDYFPVTDYADLQKTINKGTSLIERFDGDHNSLELIHRISLQKRRFRALHMAAVKKHIGTNAVGSAEGKSAMPFLHQRVTDNTAKAAIIKTRMERGL